MLGDHHKLFAQAVSDLAKKRTPAILLSSPFYAATPGTVISVVGCKDQIKVTHIVDGVAHVDLVGDPEDFAGDADRLERTAKSLLSNIQDALESANG